MTAETTRPSRGPMGFFKSLMRNVGVPLIIFLMARAILIEGFRIPSGSMENTLLIGDFLFANKLLYGAEVPLIHKRLPAIREPAVNDIVIFESVEDPGQRVVKRLVGLPGDTMAMRDNVLHRNGVALQEPWAIITDAPDMFVPQMRQTQLPYYVGPAPRTYRPTLKNWGPLVVPPDSFMVLGDNRDDSYDSRYWGFLGRDRIEGTPMFVYYSYDRGGLLPLPAITAIRWSRIFSTPD